MKIDKNSGFGELSLIKWWQGTDALKLATYPPGDFRWHVRIFFERIFWRLFHRFFIHWVNSPKLLPYLQDIGIWDAVVREVPWNQNKYRKKKHYGFYIMTYLPEGNHNRKYKDWIYGKKIIEQVESYLSDFKIYWVRLDGTQDMAKIYPLVDLYIKVNRHPGSDKNRIAKECELNGIEVYYTDYTKSDLQNAKEIVGHISAKIHSAPAA